MITVLYFCLENKKILLIQLFFCKCSEIAICFTSYSIKLCKDIFKSVKQSSFFLRIFKYYHEVIFLCNSSIDSGSPSRFFGSFQQSTFAGKRLKVVLIDCKLYFGLAIDSTGLHNHLRMNNLSMLSTATGNSFLLIVLSKLSIMGF